jgi:hypothetical protein
MKTYRNFNQTYQKLKQKRDAKFHERLQKMREETLQYILAFWQENELLNLRTDYDRIPAKIKEIHRLYNIFTDNKEPWVIFNSDLYEKGKNGILSGQPNNILLMIADFINYLKENPAQFLELLSISSDPEAFLKFLQSNKQLEVKSQMLNRLYNSRGSILNKKENKITTEEYQRKLIKSNIMALGALVNSKIPLHSNIEELKPFIKSRRSGII